MPEDHASVVTDGSSETFARQVIRHLLKALGVAALVATAFTAWTPASLDPGELVGQLLAAIERQEPLATADPGQAMLPTERAALRIGIVAGHSGLHRTSGLPDPGAVCPDGLTELDINLSIAQEVVTMLQQAGFQVDLLEEFDERLEGYKAVAIISIHADSCLPINDDATGFKAAAALDTQVPDRSQRLVTCLVDRYAQATQLRFHPTSITRDMTEYHTFYEIDEQVPAAIIEAGFMFLDREFLTEQPEVAARGIVDGLLCYVNNEPAEIPENQP
ncbi:MAG TPA: N-acetylmuramoyl-L-alanine amidase [Anaerolineae bacterium]|nr:N-acetylmuramoyl-L-alanine amidase [Anaerolineae bacterium]